MKNLAFKSLFIFVFLFYTFKPGIQAQNAEFKVAIFNMLYAINESDEGKKVKQSIQAQIEQTSKSLQSRKTEIDALVNEVQTSILLSEDAKQQKRAEAQKKMSELQRDQRDLENKFRGLEQENTQRLIDEFKVVLDEYGKDKGYDLILESQIASGLLFTKFETKDITEEVIKIYNTKNSKKK